MNLALSSSRNAAGSTDVMGLRARWTLVLVAVALVLVVGLGLGLEAARRDVASEARATWRSERAALVHAALNDHVVNLGAVLESPLVAEELPSVLADGVQQGGGAARVLADWAARCQRNATADDVLVLDTRGRLLSASPWAEGVGRIHPRAQDLREALPGPPLVYDARTNDTADTTRWVAGVVRRLRVDGEVYRLVVGRGLGSSVLGSIAQATQIQALRWGAPDAARGEVAFDLPPGWQPGFGAHLVWNPGTPATLEAFDSLRWRIVLAGAVALVVALLAAPWIAAGLGRPLVTMAAAVQAIGRGTRHPDLPLDGPREIRTLRDALVQMTRDLDRAEARIREAERRAAWREIARRVAHEIRNALSPLALAVDNVETAASREDDTARRALASSLSTARDQLHSLERLVGEFGDFARQPALEVALVDVRDLLEAAVGAVRASRPDATFRLDATGAPDSVQGDVEQLRRAVHNLLINAADADAEGPIDLVATAAVDPDRWTMEVRDRGPGPTDEILARLGEPYLTTKAMGTGLGLSITMRIVDAHGGRFELAQRDGGGAVARIELPRVLTTRDEAGASASQRARDPLRRKS